MARFSGAAVLLILVATVSVYSCAILGGATLGRTLERTMKQQPDHSLRVSIIVGRVADCFAKDLWGWGGDREGGKDHARDDGAVLLSAARASPRAETAANGEQFVMENPSLGNANAKQPSSRDDVRGVVIRPRHTNFSGEITQAPSSLGGVIKVGPWGGPGGQGFYTRGRRVPRLRRINLYHSDAIRAFSYDYLHRGVIRTEGPFGGHPHASTGIHESIGLYTDEHITAVEGTFGHCRSVPQVVITSLTFHTDQGRTFGPYGNKAAGTPFSIPAENGCIVGFWGRSGWLLDAIGVYITPCSTQVTRQIYNTTL